MNNDSGSLHRDEAEQETAFDIEEVSKITKRSVGKTLGKNAYQHNKVNEWTSSVMERCLGELAKLRKPFKYIVTCIITQKNGAGLQLASACFWDTSNDGSCSVNWENETMFCNVNVFGLAV